MCIINNYTGVWLVTKNKTYIRSTHELRSKTEQGRQDAFPSTLNRPPRHGAKLSECCCTEAIRVDLV